MTREQFIQEINSLRTSLEQIGLVATYALVNFEEDMAGYLEEFSEDVNGLKEKIKQ